VLEICFLRTVNRQQPISASLATVAMVTASKSSVVTLFRAVMEHYMQQNHFREYRATFVQIRLQELTCPAYNKTKNAVARLVTVHPVCQGVDCTEKTGTAEFWKEHVKTNILIYDTSNQPEIGSRLHHSAYSVIFRGPDVHYDVICYKVEEEIFKS